MHFGFALDLSDKRFVKYRFARSKIYTLRFVCFQYVLKTSWRHVFKTFSRYIFKTSSRRLQRNNFLSSKTSPRSLQDMPGRPLQEVLKTNKCLLETYCKFDFSKSKNIMNFVGIIIKFNCNYFHIKNVSKTATKTLITMNFSDYLKIIALNRTRSLKPLTIAINCSIIYVWQSSKCTPGLAKYICISWRTFRYYYYFWGLILETFI